MPEQNFNFKGILNGVSYTDPAKFVEDMRKATAEGNVRSISYEYCTTDTNREPAKTQPADTCKHCDKSNLIKSVSKIKDIIQSAAEFSDEIFDSDTFDKDRLDKINDVLSSSLQKIKYIMYNEMCEGDRKDFTSKLHGAMKSMFDESDSESKDLIYEEAKYRQSCIEENTEIEKKIEELKKEHQDNCKEIGWSYNRCGASESLRNFFGELLSIFEQE